ncbi:MAG: hypothetical protein CFH16_00937 [Alphaproteobacteria bacterium MarineAlpha5_Bin6]|nr:MAG: hypothetical protein CFH16_00937 [Alphaproteobacteria bacterium MarineAlpha5_Bin6]|tara:strand:- start:1947 stop:2201 length:255 start_codon:yes stop_codon:yes gene_type:complete
MEKKIILEKKLNKIFMNIFQLKNKDINKNISMQNVSKWDSLNHIGLISEIEENFNIHFNDDEIIDMTNYKSIIKKILNYEKTKK